MPFTEEQQQLWAELAVGPDEPKPAGQTLDQFVVTEASSFCYACDLMLGNSPTQAEAEEVVRVALSKSNPDAITNPRDPPTVSGTEGTRPL